MSISHFLLFLVLFNTTSCKGDQVLHVNAVTNDTLNMHKASSQPIQVGAAQTDVYLSMLAGKRVGLVINQTSVIGDDHIVDYLNSNGVIITSIFAPEHGFRGTEDAGADIQNELDKKTGIPIISLYGNKKQPSAQDLEKVDIIIFDIQDVGVRFYTYLSTLKYVMEACALHNKPLIVLDRPNPNGHYIDGPVLKAGFTSFVGVIPIPIVHGMTLGELAKMMNGEKWLKDQVNCQLTVIPCKNYKRTDRYVLPIKPSPNLPNQRSILLYPSLCLFEGTEVSVGRGTDKQFQIYGAPGALHGKYTFTPTAKPGASDPFQKGKLCRGEDLSSLDINLLYNEGKINLSYLLDAFKAYPQKESFFLKNKFFDKLAGNDVLRSQIISGLSEEEIRKSWNRDIESFRNLRAKYLIYAD